MTISRDRATKFSQTVVPIKASMLTVSHKESESIFGLMENPTKENG